jgi:hypothetical protein
VTARRTTYDARAAAGFDEAHERQLVEVLAAAIAEASLASDCNALILRTGELTSALLTLLATAIALSPSSTRSPTATRKLMGELHKRLRRRVAQAEQDPELQDSLARCFRGCDVEGSA